MKQIVSTLLILFICLTHSAWAMGVHVYTGVDHPDSHVSDIQNHTLDDNNKILDKEDSHYHCHIASHAIGLISVFKLTLTNIKQSHKVENAPTIYLHSQTPPFRPPISIS